MFWSLIFTCLLTINIQIYHRHLKLTILIWNTLSSHFKLLISHPLFSSYNSTICRFPQSRPLCSILEVYLAFHAILSSLKFCWCILLSGYLIQCFSVFIRYHSYLGTLEKYRYLVFNSDRSVQSFGWCGRVVVYFNHLTSCVSEAMFPPHPHSYCGSPLTLSHCNSALTLYLVCSPIFLNTFLLIAARETYLKDFPKISIYHSVL